MIRAVLFDMDGTILNTIDDITDSVNMALSRAGCPHGFAPYQVQFCFGCGIQLDIEKSLALSKGCPLPEIEEVGKTIPVSRFGVSEELVNRVKSLFNSCYGTRNMIHTAPYPGILPLLHHLKEKGMLLAVASNKNDEVVQKLNTAEFQGLFDFVIGNSPHIRRKPYPDMIEKILKTFHVKHEEAVYVGDTEVDLETARNAGISCISVSWGFRGSSFLKAHHASCIADSASMLEKEILSIQ